MSVQEDLASLIQAFSTMDAHLIRDIYLDLPEGPARRQACANALLELTDDAGRTATPVRSPRSSRTSDGGSVPSAPLTTSSSGSSSSNAESSERRSSGNIAECVPEWERTGAARTWVRSQPCPGAGPHYEVTISCRYPEVRNALSKPEMAQVISQAVSKVLTDPNLQLGSKQFPFHVRKFLSICGRYAMDPLCGLARAAVVPTSEGWPSSGPEVKVCEDCGGVSGVRVEMVGLGPTLDSHYLNIGMHKVKLVLYHFAGRQMELPWLDLSVLENGFKLLNEEVCNPDLEEALQPQLKEMCWTRDKLSGVLLYGPPGTAKTTIQRMVPKFFGLTNVLSNDVPDSHTLLRNSKELAKSRARGGPVALRAGNEGEDEDEDDDEERGGSTRNGDGIGDGEDIELEIGDPRRQDRKDQYCDEDKWGDASTLKGGAVLPAVALSSQTYKGLGVEIIRTLSCRCQKFPYWPCLFAIDEIDSAAEKRDPQTGHSTSREQTSAFLPYLPAGNPAKANCLVIGATNIRKAMDQAVLRRLPITIFVGNPSTEAKKRIVELFLRREVVLKNFVGEGCPGKVSLESFFGFLKPSIVRLSRNFSGCALKELIELLGKQYITYRSDPLCNSFVSGQQSVRYHEGSQGPASVEATGQYALLRDRLRKVALTHNVNLLEALDTTQLLSSQRQRAELLQGLLDPENCCTGLIVVLQGEDAQGAAFGHGARPGLRFLVERRLPCGRLDVKSYPLSRAGVKAEWAQVQREAFEVAEWLAVSHFISLETGLSPGDSEERQCVNAVEILEQAASQKAMVVIPLDTIGAVLPVVQRGLQDGLQPKQFTAHRPKLLNTVAETLALKARSGLRAVVAVSTELALVSFRTATGFPLSSEEEAQQQALEEAQQCRRCHKAFIPAQNGPLACHPHASPLYACIVTNPHRASVPSAMCCPPAMIMGPPGMMMGPIGMMMGPPGMMMSPMMVSPYSSRSPSMAPLDLTVRAVSDDEGVHLMAQPEAGRTLIVRYLCCWEPPGSTKPCPKATPGRHQSMATSSTGAVVVHRGGGASGLTAEETTSLERLKRETQEKARKAMEEDYQKRLREQDEESRRQREAFDMMRTICSMSERRKRKGKG